MDYNRACSLEDKQCYNVVIDKREIYLHFTASPQGHSTRCIELLFHRLKIPLHGITVHSNQSPCRDTKTLLHVVLASWRCGPVG